MAGRITNGEPPSQTAKPTKEPGAARDVKLRVFICLALAGVTLAAFWPVLRAGFTEVLDDSFYVKLNPFITNGLTTRGIVHAFTSFDCANWHPLTWMSHMLDCQLYGLNPAGHHATSLLFHVANALLCFVVLSRMTGSVWRSGFVAALFAVHPLHVESVAWISERKDVLSAFLWMLTMYAYVLYVRRPDAAAYGFVLVFYALGLMSKPMLVSLPLVLLLLDFWPLRRLEPGRRLFLEKAPLFAMSAASCVVTLFAQRAGGAYASLELIPIVDRFGNAAISYWAYLAKTIWPARLAPFYPLIGPHLPVWKAAGAGIALAVATVLVVRSRARYPYLMVGWLWYLVTLVPVIGLVQVGGQSMADRYTYVPLVGIFVAVAWLVPELVAARCGAWAKLASVCGAALIPALAVCTYVQAGFWHDSRTLFEHALRVTRPSAFAYDCLGQALANQNDLPGAIAQFRKATKALPPYPQAYLDLGHALDMAGNTRDAVIQWRKAIRFGLDKPELHYNIAEALFRLADADQAERECRIALRQDRSFGMAHNLLGVILVSRGRLDDAIREWRTAVDCDPDNQEPHGNLARAYFEKGDYRAAWDEVQTQMRLGGRPDPRFVREIANRLAALRR